MRTPCATYGDLGAYVLGALAPEQAAAVRAHLDGCPLCRAEMRDLAWIPALLSLVRAEDVEPSIRPRRPIRVRWCTDGRSEADD